MSLETTSSLWFAIISTLTRYWAFSGITLTSWGSACDAADGAQGEVSVSTTFVPLFVFILGFFFRSPSETREARLGRTRPARTGKAGRAFLPLALPPIPDRAARSDQFFQTYPQYLLQQMPKRLGRFGIHFDTNDAGGGLVTPRSEGGQGAHVGLLAPKETARPKPQCGSTRSTRHARRHADQFNQTSRLLSRFSGTATTGPPRGRKNGRM